MVARVTYSDLLEFLAENSGFPKSHLTEFMKELINTIKIGLKRDGRVVIKEIGIFELRWHKARQGRHPISGETILIPGQSRVHFKPDIQVRRFINKKYAHLRPVVLGDKYKPTAEVSPPPIVPVKYPRENLYSSIPERSRSRSWYRFIWIGLFLITVLS